MLLKDNEDNGKKTVLRGERKDKKREKKRKREIKIKTRNLILHQQSRLVVILKKNQSDTLIILFLSEKAQNFKS